MFQNPSIAALFKEGRPLRSLEFFPPKNEEGVKNLRSTARALQLINPDFVSVTYGAGGSTRERTAQVSTILKEEMGFTVMPHLTCVAHTREELKKIAQHLYADGFRNIMALRGDPPKGDTIFRPVENGLSHASELVSLLKELHDDFCIGVAGYPDKHPEAVSMDADLEALKKKVDAGAAFVTTQLFFDNDAYFRFVDGARRHGITVPIIPGILPPISVRQIQRFSVMGATRIPARLLKSLAQVEGDSAQEEAVGVEWTFQQLRELLAAGAPGYHLYILNKAGIALALAKGLQA